MAAHLARALNANLIPCEVGTRRPLVRWAALHSPGSARLSLETLAEWAAHAAERERAGKATAWAVLPGSARLLAFDVDEPEQVPRLLEIHGPTPLIVRSPTPGRAHLWYRWPAGTDVGCVGQEALPGYAVKARGGMIHAPGSLHRSGLGFYRAELHPSEWTAELAGRLPEADLAAIDADRVGRLDLGALAGLPESWAGADEAERRGIAWLRAAGPPEPGGRENKTWRAAMTLGDLGVPEDVALRLIVAWDAEGPAPRGAAEASDTARRAYARRRLPGGVRRLPDGGEVDAEALFAGAGEG